MIRFALLLLLLALASGVVRADEVSEVLKASAQAQRAARESQLRINSIGDEIRKLHQQQQDVRGKALQMAAYAAQLEVQAREEEEKGAAIEAQVAGIEDTEANLLPLVESMVADLDTFVEADLPFQQELRQRRIRELHALIEDPERSTADKFRRVLDAYRSEVDYGYSLGVEESEITLNGSATKVSLIRIGRLGLFFLTEDGSRAGHWHPLRRGWRDLDAAVIPELNRALTVASGEGPPELLALPVLVPK